MEDPLTPKEGVILFQRVNEQEIEGKPDWAAPVRVPPKEAGVGFSGKKGDHMILV